MPFGRLALLVLIGNIVYWAALILGVLFALEHFGFIVR